MLIEDLCEGVCKSVDSETSEITHYHIVIFRNTDGKMTMLLSKPVLREIDISEYVVGEI